MGRDERSRTVLDFLIVGAGPAGLQLGYFLEKAGLDYLILERGAGPGTFFEEFPRHRKLISINKVHTGYSDPETNLRWDWNSLLTDDERHVFKNYTEDYFPAADVLLDYLRDYADGLKVEYDVEVLRISREEGDFKLDCGDGKEFWAKRLIVATGISKAYLPDIPGIELTENYIDMPIEPEDYAGQEVLIIGKGNSGLETADNLIPTASVLHIASPNPIKFAWQTHHVGHLRALNNNFLDTYQLKAQNAVLDATIKRIEARGDKFAVFVSYSHASGEEEELIYDRILTCTGFKFDASIFDHSCRPRMAINDRFPAQTSSWESVNVPDLYFAGVLMQMRDFKKYTSAFIHGFRYNVRSLYRMMAKKYGLAPWPSTSYGSSPEELAAAFLRRINSTSGLWQQFKFMGDLIVIEGDRAQHYEEMPVEFIHDGGLGSPEDFYVLSLEFGHSQDPFNVARNPIPERASDSFFLHPVLRHYVGGVFVSEHHILEDLYASWNRPKLHVEPLLDYLRAEAGYSRTPVVSRSKGSERSRERQEARVRA